MLHDYGRFNFRRAVSTPRPPKEAKPKFKHWTKDEIEEAAELWKAGKTASEIGAHFGVERNSIIGLTNRNRALFGNKPKAQGGKKNRIPPDLLDRAAELWMEGYSMAVIGKMVGRAGKTVSEWVEKRPERFPPRAHIVAGGFRKPPKQEDDGPVMQPVKDRGYDFTVYAIAGTVSVNILDHKAGECRFPLTDANTGHGPNAMYCGQPIGGKGSYCAAHRSLVYRRDA